MAIRNGNDASNNLRGTEGNDIINGFGGDDFLYANDGDDVIDPGTGRDFVGCGDGNDLVKLSAIWSGSTMSQYHGGHGFDILDASFTQDSLAWTWNFTHEMFEVAQILFGDFERVISGSGNDRISLYLAPATIEIHGGGGDDSFSGSGNPDKFFGGADNDTFNAGHGDRLFGEDGNDTIRLSSTISDIFADGGAGTDTISISAGNPTIDLMSTEGPATFVSIENATVLPGDYTQKIFGTDGANSFVCISWGGASARVFFYGRDGDDYLQGAGANDVLSGDEGSDRVQGNGGADKISGGAGNDILSGGKGDDQIDGGDGIDTASFEEAQAGVTASLVAGTASGDGADLLIAIENVRGTNGTDGITGNEGANRLEGLGGNDKLFGGAGNDYLDGGAHADQMTGDSGNDTYIVRNIDDQVVEKAGEGSDLAQSSVSYTLPDHVEALTLTGSAAIAATGNALANSLTGNSGANRLDGKQGADTMAGGLGDDVFIVDTFTASAATPDDVVVELSGGGDDTVESSVTYALAANVETLLLTGNAVGGTGNSAANTIIGNGAANSLDGGAGHDLLDGGTGADRMIGGSGDDTFVVDTFTTSSVSPDDIVVEASSGGTDTVRSSVSYILVANVENLVLTGTAGLTGTGNSLANLLSGNDGSNRLNGMAGADTMSGGLGNDVYVVDTYSSSTAVADDLVVEAVAGGTDRVESSVTYLLAANVENLILTGTGDIGGTGNSLANYLAGNGGANRLDGGAGADTMTGGAGNDTYVVDTFSTAPDTADDLVIEAAGGGADTIESSVDYKLGAELEHLLLTGTAVNGTGNSLANRLTGNAAANILTGGSGNDTLRGAAGTDALDGGPGSDRLDGGSGADTMAGGSDNDTYVVDNLGDKVIENGSSGTDTVESSVDYSLPTHVEKLVLTGTAGIDGRGNSGANTITGNSGSNFLNGSSGNDVIDAGAGNDRVLGGPGNDSLKGGTGIDRFEFTTALGTTNVDKILDFSVASDTIYLLRSVFTGAGANGTLAATAFHQGTAAADAGDRIVYDSATGKIFYDADGTGAAAQILFGTVTAGTALTNADFVIYG